MNRFNRIENLIGKDQLELIKSKKVLIAGLGGVGGYALESLARSGIENFVLVDKDVVDITNLNRQIITTEENIGKKKIDEASKRIKSINPNINIVAYDTFLDINNIDEIVSDDIDYVVDAIDTLTSKVDLWKYLEERNIKFISCLGMARRLNPQEVTITTLDKTSYDPMAKSLRSIARKKGVNINFPVVFSKEKPLIESNGEKSSLGSMVFVPAYAGLLCGYYVINDIIHK